MKLMTMDVNERNLSTLYSQVILLADPRTGYYVYLTSCQGAARRGSYSHQRG